MVVLIVNEKDFCYYRNYVCITTGISLALRKNRSMSPSRIYSLAPGLGSDPPYRIGSGMGRDNNSKSVSNYNLI